MFHQIKRKDNKMKNYIIMQASVFEGTRKDGTKYYWTTGALYDYEHPEENRQQLANMTMVNEEQCKLFKAYSVAEANTTDRRLAGRTETKLFNFDYKAASKAYSEALAAIKAFKAGTKTEEELINTPLVIQVPKFDMTTGEMGVDYKAMCFYHKPRVVMVREQLKEQVAPIATHVMTVTVNGAERVVNPGEFIPNKWGRITPVTEITFPMQVGSDGEYIEDKAEVLNRILESRYKKYQPTAETAPIPSGAPSVTQPEEDKEAQEAANAFLNATGGVPTI